MIPARIIRRGSFIVEKTCTAQNVERFILVQSGKTGLARRKNIPLYVHIRQGRAFVF
jgi:hypothetical protein